MPQEYATMDYQRAVQPITNSISGMGQSVSNTIGAIGDPLIKKAQNSQQNQILHSQVRDLFGHLHGVEGVDIDSLAPHDNEDSTAYKQRVGQSMAPIMDQLVSRGIDPRQLGGMIGAGASWDQLKGYVTADDKMKTQLEEESKVKQFRDTAMAPQTPVTPQVGLPGQVSAPQPIRVSNPATDDRRANVENVVNQAEQGIQPTDTSPNGLQPLPLQKKPVSAVIPQTPGKNAPQSLSAFPSSYEDMQASVLNENPPQAMTPPQSQREMKQVQSNLDLGKNEFVNKAIENQGGVEGSQAFQGAGEQPVSQVYAGIGASQGEIPKTAEDIGKARQEEDKIAAAKKKAQEQNTPELNQAQKELAEWAVRNNQPFGSVLGNLGFGGKGVDRIGLKNYMIQYARSIGKEYNDVEAQAGLSGARSGATARAQLAPDIVGGKAGKVAAEQSAKQNQSKVDVGMAANALFSPLMQKDGHLDPKLLAPMNVGELFITTAKMLNATGQLSNEQLETVSQPTMAQSVAKLTSYFGHQVGGATTQQVLENMYHLIQREGKQAQSAVTSATGGKAQQFKELGPTAPHATPKNQAEYDALPKDASYIDSDGKTIRIKG